MKLSLRILTLFLALISTEMSAGEILSISKGGEKENFTDATGKRQGYWVITGAITIEEGYKKSTIVEEGEYIDNKRQGVWRKYYPTGSLKSEITYELNRPDGFYAIYYPNGQVEESGFWKGNKNVGSFRRYYENGNPAQEFEFTNTGKRNGLQNYYYENGELQMTVEIENGVAHGKMVTYYPDGSKKLEQRITNGNVEKDSVKKYKSIKSYSKSDHASPELPKVETQAIQDKPNLQEFKANGQNTLYNKNQQVSQVGQFKNGRLWNGKWFRYDVNGLLKNVEVYKNGRFIGYGIIEKSNN